MIERQGTPRYPLATEPASALVAAPHSTAQLPARNDRHVMPSGIEVAEIDGRLHGEVAHRHATDPAHDALSARPNS
jgi:hypothetical protein